MRRLALAALGMAAVSCGGAGKLYTRNDLQLITAYTAKEVCSCMFVMERSEDFCRAWTQANPAIATFSVDEEAKTVTSSAAMMWGVRARWMGQRDGCQLE